MATMKEVGKTVWMNHTEQLVALKCFNIATTKRGTLTRTEKFLALKLVTKYERLVQDQSKPHKPKKKD